MKQVYKTASPYIKELLKGEIKWNSFSQKALAKAIKEDKPIFVHIGNISNIEQRNFAYNLFKNKDVTEILNNNFIPIAIDTEDIPEAYLIGMDLLLINEKKISDHINIFSLPGIKPVTSFSSHIPSDFLHIAKNLLHSFRHNRQKLEQASHYLTQRLKFSGIVTRKEKPGNISPKLLHAYIKSWSKRFLDPDIKNSKSPYTLSARNLNFILEYACKYNVTEYINYINQTLEHVYHSAVFDPIDGGIFSASADYSFKNPSYEKNIYENANAVILYSTAYKYLRKKIYKEAAERIVQFLEEQMNLQKKGYMTYITLNKEGKESTYYKYSLKELENAFPDRYKEIARKLGMNANTDADIPQIISNTPSYWEISYEELKTLKKIRIEKRKEVIYDKRTMTGYNCRTAVAFCTMAKHSDKAHKQEYLTMAKEIIDNIANHRIKGKANLYKYISSTRVEYSTSDLYDYSLFLNCLLNYYILTKETKYGDLAKNYAAYIIFNHYQPSNGMFTKTARYEARIPVKRAPVIDYNTLSSNSIMADNLLLLYKITGNDIYIKTFKQQIYNIQPQLIGSGPFMAGWGMQVLNYLTEELTLSPEQQ